MYIVKNTTLNEITIKNSKFIALVYPVDNIIVINDILTKTKQKYKDATHIVYAYKLINKEKYSDDKEPSGTAGLPVMEVINKKKLVNILIIVIRYFGGIKLGAGGLIRAYSNAAKECLKNAEIAPYLKYNYYLLTACYDDLKLLNTLTSNLNIVSKSFNDKIVYKIKIEEEQDNILEIFKDQKIIVQKTENI